MPVCVKARKMKQTRCLVGCQPLCPLCMEAPLPRGTRMCESGHPLVCRAMGNRTPVWRYPRYSSWTGSVRDKHWPC